MLVNIQDVVDKSFDYIIVGGGTSGLTLAARLSEDAETTVLVLEAGEANLDDPELLRPAMFDQHFTNPSYSWSHRTVKQKYTKDAQQDWIRGKGLGGSSAINFMCWTNPPAEEINDLERLGNPGWNWSMFERLQQKVERFVTPSKEVQAKLKIDFDSWTLGRDGAVNLTYPPNIEEGELKLQQTLINAGIPVAANPYGGDPKGAFFAANCHDPQTYTRSYATTAYYIPNKYRLNLSVLVSAHANRILTTRADDDSVTGVGVEFRHGQSTYTANATKEIILCAGALKTPQLLELSGFGAKDILDKLCIPVAKELPGVGNNVQEHVNIGPSFEVRDNIEWDTFDLLRDPCLAAKQLDAAGSGLYTKGPLGFCFASLSMIYPDTDAFLDAAERSMQEKIATCSPGLRDQYKILFNRIRNGSPGFEFISLPKLMSLPNPPKPGKRYVTVMTLANYLFSRGTIHANTNDPSEDPEFDPHYFEEPIDLDVLVEMVKFARRLAEVPPFRDMIVGELNPGPEVKSDSELREWIMKYFSTTWHTAGSCSMLPEDKGGVVDPNLKVYGTSNIRVADLSILPLHIAAHPQSTVYIIAERAAELIRESSTRQSTGRS